MVSEAAVVPGLGPSSRLRYPVLALWAVAFGRIVAVQGIPQDRGWQTVRVISGLLAVRVGDPWADKGRIVLDWLPFLALLYLYDYSRGLADGLGMPVHVSDLLATEKALFGGEVPTIWMQDRYYEPGVVHWYDVANSLVYFSHFFAVFAIAAVLYARNRELWLRWVRRILALSFAALVTYVLLPAAPPWFAAEAGLTEPVARISNLGWTALGLEGAGSLIERGQADVNLVAAVPSLHTGFSVLICAFFITRVPNWAKPLLVAYPTAMVVTLVYSGEHYVVDALLGVVYVLLVMWGVGAWERRRMQAESADGPGDAQEPTGVASEV